VALNDLSSRVLDVQCSVDRLGLGTCGDVGECAEDCVKEPRYQSGVERDRKWLSTMSKQIGTEV